MAPSHSSIIPLLLLFLYLCLPVSAFGAGNIASISRIEGKNWRHGDIEDTLKTIAFVKGMKWTSMMVKRVYFGNWLRDYSQAVDVGTLKGCPAETIRVLLWILSFLTFGYATAEFEVTAERLGCYRPEEHIDNPKDYADNQDARKYDARLRGPVQPIELEIDPKTGLKNYIANETLGIATSVGYVKHSLTRCIHFGRMYRHGAGGKKGREEDLCEALRCLGQALHCCEDFGAHSNYCELALREMGYRNVFPHCGVQAEINLRGHRVFPIVTGTFGGVDFLHSVIGEANDHFTQSEVDELDKTLMTAQTSAQGTSRSLDGDGDDSAGILIGLLSQMPGTGDLGEQARQLQSASQEQERLNAERGIAAGGEVGSSRGLQSERGYNLSQGYQSSNDPDMLNRAGPQSSSIPGADRLPESVQSIDPQEIIKKIYPILVFRDRVVKTIDSIIAKIPGLEALVEKITETLTLFVLRLMAPFVRPLIDVVSKQLKSGSSTIIDSSGKHQYEPWTDPHCTDPTHSLLSKDHFTNILNEIAGQVASQILRYVVPRVLWAWEHPDAGLDQVMQDVTRVFHHPAIRDMNNEVHRSMYETVERWARQCPHNLDQILSSESVRAGKNQIGTDDPSIGGGSALGAMQSMFGQGGTGAATSNLAQGNSAWNLVQKLSGGSGGGGGSGSTLGSLTSAFGKMSGLGDGMRIPGMSRELDFEAEAREVSQAFPGTETEYDNMRPPPGSGPEFGGRTPSPYPPDAFGYQTGPQFSGGYEQGYQGAPPLYHGYGGPPMGYPAQGPPFESPPYGGDQSRMSMPEDGYGRTGYGQGMGMGMGMGPGPQGYEGGGAGGYGGGPYGRY